MAIERVGKPEQDASERRLSAEDRHELLAFESKETRELAVRRMSESRQAESGEDRTTQAVDEASRVNSRRGAEWQDYAERNAQTVPVSVNQLAAQQANRVEPDNNVERVGASSESNAARHEQQRETIRRQAEQQMTIADIQADILRRSGLVRG
ncbi:MAG TPA: hypothetical protein VLC93_00810 [Myxococcota bacterium]|nr:hypothetical protein [Myxococcota bacterium]